MARRGEPMALCDGSRIAVVGAGPAGSLFACQVLRLARERGIELAVTLVERKVFSSEGLHGCNHGAGVVCSELLGHLAEMGIELPADHIQRSIEGYWLETKAGQLHMPRAVGHGQIVTVYRGSGPRSAPPHIEIGFDDHLLKHALDLGAQFVSGAVERVEPSPDGAGPATVTYRTERGSETMEADLAVVACGINSTLPARLAAAGFGYRGPRGRRACQVEIPLDDGFIDEQFGNDIHMLDLGLERVRFAAFVPKRGFVTLTLIGRGDLGPADLRRFVERPELLAKLPSGWELSDRFCRCWPLLPMRAARRPVADRLVVVGDAAVSRYVKNGLGSAYTTATLAARAALDHGVAARSLLRHYWRPARCIARDNVLGRALFAVASLVARSRMLASVCFDLSLEPPSHRSARTFHFINWSLITGDRPYREVAWAVASPAFLFGLLVSAARLAVRKLASPLRPHGQVRVGGRGPRHPARLGPLRDGQTVAIIGGGPAGASCAIALKHLAARRGIALDVVLYEAKDFGTGHQYNQCAGLLSPPIVEVLEQRLGVAFPHDLVQREITEYELRGESERLRLSGGGEPSLALRRVQFDHYLLRETMKRGVKVVRARVHDLEVRPHVVRVFSESGSQAADVVVGAFGPDEGSGDAFRRATGYRRPPFIETLVTKLHPPPDQMARRGTRAYAFLPAIRGVEFAAVIPKGNHLTIVVAGRRLSSAAMDALLEWAPMREIVRQEECVEESPEYYKGRFPSAGARYACGERYVVVGDASGLVRPFKGKGVTTACLTGYLAAATMMDVGIGEPAMRRFLADCHELTSDIFYGRVVRRLVRLAGRSGAVDELIRQAREDETLRAAIYCCVSGEGSFRDMLLRTVGLRRGWRAGCAVLRGLLRGRRSSG